MDVPSITLPSRSQRNETNGLYGATWSESVPPETCSPIFSPVAIGGARFDPSGPSTLPTIPPE